MTNWKECGWKWSWPNLRYYPGISLEAVRKITRNFSWSLGRDLTPGPLKLQSRSVNHSTITFDGMELKTAWDYELAEESVKWRHLLL
jgi:hypothetical protein